MHFTKVLLSAIASISVVLVSPIMDGGAVVATSQTVAYPIDQILHPRSELIPDPPPVCNKVEGDLAISKAIYEGVRYLHKQEDQGIHCDSGPKYCNRVSCSWNSAIYVCNDNDFGISNSCHTVAEYAKSIVDECQFHCSRFNQQCVKGQFFDTAKWNVVQMLPVSLEAYLVQILAFDRLLKFFGQHAVKATWFTPSYTLVSFPDQMAKVRDAGHEIALHGYTHERASRLTEEQERKIMAKSIEVYRDFAGKHPKGWAAPYWDVSPRSMQILEDFGIEYDHSLMHHDCQLYYASDVGDSVIHTDYSKEPETWMVPMRKHKMTKVVEIPASWDVDDWPPMNLSPPSAGGHSHPHHVQQSWEDQFSYLYKEYDTFVFCISIHPQVSGKAKVMSMHERFIEFLKKHEGVEFVPAEYVCGEFKAGKIAGATFEMGV
ncbi:hypothetical protein B0O99DRAFT_691003 [Bisporella sp. PMI_857]|nr:hypothetical protein B0O99DRAFT_691003 [Bisporella sp. PMI_857]